MSLLISNNVLKINHFREMTYLQGGGNWERFCVLVRDSHASSSLSTSSPFDARHVTVFFRSQASSSFVGYKTALPILTKAGPIFIARQFRRVPIETLPRYLSETSSAVRNFLSDINLSLALPTADHLREGLRALNHAHALSDGTAARSMEGEDFRRRENGRCGIEEGAVASLCAPEDRGWQEN